MSIKQTPWLRAKKRLKWVLNKDITEGIFLLLGVIVALIWANSPGHESYHHLWEQKLSIRFGSFQFEQNFHHLINDGLMAIFFFLVGLEIKREVMVGELSTFRKALFPIICAAGGMLFPALIYFAFNPSGDAADGWGVPVATDIAFALVLVSVLGKRVPVALKVFLAALAIADDLGAVMVIAIFYTDEIVINSLLIAFSVFGFLIVANRFGIRNPWFYGLVGMFGIWLAFLQSGVHATIAGVIIAMAIPTDVLIRGDKYAYKLKQLGRKFKRTDGHDHQMATDDQLEIVGNVKKVTKAVMPPLQKIEHAISPFVSYLILPLFALANAGVRLETSFWEAIQSPVSLGIIFGLVFGKTIGIMGFARLSTWLGITQIPAAISWRQLLGAASFAGIGFTMSLFIAELAFNNEALLVNAKFGILLASVVAASIGLIIFLGFRPKEIEVTLPSEKE
ncbi:MAG TPA: Na+/H+ antiporter NhaA [Saprospiraceae bacterium]|nr:Na+/H+ antiporter NhaA [Saprospiraceae bacterium]